MLKISKLTDYSTVVMSYLARAPEQVHNARDITVHTQIAQPTVSKILKMLASSGLLISQRGVNGGYSLARSAEKITVAEIITAMEGKPGLTECSHSDTHCVLEPSCAIRGNWRTISDLIYSALENITLQEMVKPLQTHSIRLDDVRQKIHAVKTFETGKVNDDSSK